MLGWLPLLALAGSTAFEVRDAGSEMVAEITLAAKTGAVAEIRVDGRPVQHLTSWGGGGAAVFLGPLAAGRHAIEVEGKVVVREVTRGSREWLIIAHAPVIFARPDTIGKFSDYPMFAYAERLDDGSLQYTVVFSNEDGGTSTRALMARWGRTTDIEFVYRVWPKADGSPGRTLIQVKDHKEVEFTGRYDGWHPLLAVATRNNMVSDAGESEARYQLAPREMSFAAHSREEAMDERPASYRAASEELAREGKLRPFGTVDGQKISDPRNYVVIEAKVENRQSAVAALVQVRGEDGWRASHLGRADYAIERSGWVRTTVELPVGTRTGDVAAIGFECFIAPSREMPLGGECRVERVSKVFLLDTHYQPGASLWSMTEAAVIPAGQARLYPLSRK